MEENEIEKPVEAEVCDTENTQGAPSAQEEPSAEQPTKNIDLEAAKELIERHFLRLVEFIKFYKNKDANILTLTKELQQYRNGFELGLFKSFAQNLIAYREECRRTVRGFGSHKLSRDEGVKYLGFMVQEYEDLLQNLGIEEDGGEYLYNGKPLHDDGQRVTFREIPEFEAETLPDMPIDTTDALILYLQKCEEAVSKSIQNSAAMDSVLADYISATKLYESGIHQVVLYPIVRQIVSAYQELSADVARLNETITDENASEYYIGELEKMVEQSDKLLSLCGVMIDGYVSDTFDPKKQRVLKLIPTEDSGLAGKVAERYTDCYLLEDKVIYPSKVDVYKLK